MAMLKSSLLPWSARIRHARIHGRCRVGNRDYVGYCVNGSANYRDDAHYPFPSVRFKENTEDVCALRRKECGDWRSLCCEEKKALYRASFCQTFAEFQHPTGLWKVVIGGIFFTTSFAFWFISFYHNYAAYPLEAASGRAAASLRGHASGDAAKGTAQTEAPLSTAKKPTKYGSARGARPEAALMDTGLIRAFQEPVPESYGLEPRMAQLRRMLELHVQPIEGLSSKWDYDNDRWKVSLAALTRTHT
ncbi:hypothetical protein MSG28_013902 [Choristoneura fumiferana]|uniref:Uncharacterized protein n=1 Tax=Choristoneura fumiferana TaxID=7141 RepID=A0ACC0K9F0_CHOFU|nr:hypothetical protein MSG28_013902 [Choristoneura fumiferana]